MGALIIPPSSFGNSTSAGSLAPVTTNALSFPSCQQLRNALAHATLPSSLPNWVIFQTPEGRFFPQNTGVVATLPPDVMESAKKAITATQARFEDVCLQSGAERFNEIVPDSNDACDPIEKLCTTPYFQNIARHDFFLSLLEENANPMTAENVARSFKTEEERGQALALVKEAYELMGNFFSTQRLEAELGESFKTYIKDAFLDITSFTSIQRTKQIFKLTNEQRFQQAFQLLNQIPEKLFRGYIITTLRHGIGEYLGRLKAQKAPQAEIDKVLNQIPEAWQQNFRQAFKHFGQI